MFDLLIRCVQELDYSTMEYLGSIDNPDDMFHAKYCYPDWVPLWMLPSL